MHSSEAQERLCDWRPARVWLKESASTIFVSAASFEWFVRQNRQELIDSGEYIPGRGPRGALVGPNIDPVVLGILKRKSATA